MKKFLVIGGGLSGLIAAKALQEKGFEWIGLEKAEKMGGRLMHALPRIFNEPSRHQLEALFPNTEWERVEQNPLEAKKGEWVTQQTELEPWEAYFSKTGFYSPARPSDSWLLQGVSEEILGKFLMGHAVARISAEEKKVWCTNGTEWEYEKAFWCAPIADFFKVCASANTWKLPKKRRELGCVVLEMHLSEVIVDNRNSLGISFRFGDGKTRASGTPLIMADGKQMIFWNLYLDESISENKEEVAHCLRNFKRELFRQFPQVEAKVESERIVYLPRIVLEPPVENENFELAPDFFYLGAEARLKDAPEEMEHLDLLLKNSEILFSQAPWA